MDHTYSGSTKHALKSSNKYHGTFFSAPFPHRTDIDTAGSCLCLQHKSVVNHEWVLFCIVSRRFWAEWAWWIDLQFRGQMRGKKILDYTFFLTPMHSVATVKYEVASQVTGRLHWLATLFIVALLTEVHYAHAASCFVRKQGPSALSPPLRLASTPRFRGTVGKDESWLSWLLTEEINHSAHQRIAFQSASWELHYPAPATHYHADRHWLARRCGVRSPTSVTAGGGWDQSRRRADESRAGERRKLEC